MERQAIGEIVFSVFVIALATAVLVDISRIPAPVFDPLGAATVPRIVSIALIVLAVWIGAKAALRIRRPRTSRDDADQPTPRDYWHVAIVSVATILMVVGIAHAVAPFSVLTTAFLIIATSTLAGWRRRTVLISSLTSPIVGIAMEVTFTQVFLMDLPAF